MTLLSLDRAWGGPGHLPLPGALRVLLQVMSELDEWHEGRGEVHGELTPELIFLTEDSRVRLAPPARPFAAGVTGPYRLHYLAPEKLRGEVVGARADVFSVGVLLWEALAGKPLLELTALEDILARWRADVAPLAPVRHLHLWGRSLSHIAARALAIEPTQRYANIRQFQAAVETLAGRHAANLDAWDAMLKGPPRVAATANPEPRGNGITAPLRTQTEADLARLPDLSHLTGDVPRVPFQTNADDTVFDITARPPDLELEEAPAAADWLRALPQVARALAPPEDDELPTRFMAARARAPAALPIPKHPARPCSAPPARIRRAPIARPREAQPSPTGPARPTRLRARTAWVLVVLLAALVGALSAQLAQSPEATQPSGGWAHRTAKIQQPPRPLEPETELTK